MASVPRWPCVSSALVHLTWNEEYDPRWPNCRLFDNVEERNEFVLSLGDG